MSKIFNETDPIGKPLLLGNHTLPGVWQYMLPKEFLSFSFPEERRSTCMSCPKACYEGYRNDYRCCTYHPRIPNFLMGLAAQTPSGRSYVKKVVKQGMATPEGMNSSPQQWVNYLDDLEHDKFGQSQQVLCPMLEESSGYCMVHAFRNSVCSTFFCLKDHGNHSETFWNALQTLGSQCEMAVAQWAMEQIGFSVKDYTGRLNRLGRRIAATNRSNGQGWSESSLKELWGDWAGRELEFYEACGKLVSNHRHVLWEIANETDIVEASKFDQAMVKSVPEYLQDQVDPSDLIESGDTIPPHDLWQNVLKAYRKLWKLPMGRYALHKTIQLFPNKKSDAMEKQYKHLDYTVAKIRKSGKVDWRLFVSKQQYEVLNIFQEPRDFGWQLLTSPPLAGLAAPKAFLTEMVAKKILVKH